MALFKLSEVSEEERKKYLQSIGIDAEKFQNAQETKIKNEQKSENLLPIETKNTDKFPIQEKNTTNNFPIKQKSENNIVTNKKLSEMVQGPSKENNNSQNRFNFRQANQTANKNENKQLNAKVTTEKEQEQIKKSGGIEYDTNAVKEAMEMNKDNSKGNINSSISHVLNGVLEGAKSNFAGVGQSALFPIANALRMAEEVTGKKQQAQEKDNEEDLWSNKVLDMADYLKEESQHHSKVGSMLENNITRDLGNISNTVGNMAMSAISNIAIPGSGIIETGVSAGGNSAGETLNEDRSNLIQAIATGTAKGAVEGFTEKITGGNMLGKGSLDDLAENIIGNRIKSKAGKKIASKMYEFGGEILEEQISNNAGYVIDKIINNKDLPSFEQWINEANETTKNTFLTTLALNMLGMGGSTYKDSKIDIKDEQAQKYLNEAQKIIDNENIAENIKNNVTNQYNYKNTILSDLKASNLSNETKNEIQQYLKENNITEEQFNQISETLKQEKMSKEEQSNINSNEIKYQYEESDNEKVNKLRQDIVNNNWNNSQETKNFANMLEKIITDKDIEIRLDSNLKDSEGNIANGSYKDGVITINPNSDRSGEFLAIHELTHAIGTDEMRNMVQKYRESNTEFNSAVEKLLGTYEASELNDEALADISGQLFSNQEFINNIANTKPSVFRKIYNEIKYLWHQFRGYKNQNQFVNDLYYKWTQAYNSNNKLNDTTKYSKQGSENNSGSFDLLKDDRGRVLTKGQQERYKNVSAELKDNNGNLKTLYHQTDAEFTTFDTTKRTHSKGDAQMPDGIFLKDTPKNIGIGNNSKQMEVYAKIENPLVVENRNELEQIIRNHSREYSDLLDNNINIDEYYNKKTEEIEEQISKIYEDKWNKKRNGENTQELDNKMEQLEKEADSLFEKWNSGINDNATASREIATEILKKLGYDGVVINKDAGSFGRSIKTYLAFNSNQIKNVDNINPTDNPDVRYSKENSTWREYLESHFKSTGTRTDMSKLPIDTKIIENRKQQIINKAQQIEKTNPDFQGLADEIKNNYLGKDFDYDTYKQMNEYLDSIKPKEKDILEITTFNDSVDRRKTYMKYKNDTSDFNSNEVNLALDTIKANRNDKRTVSQWKKVAEQIGEQLAVNEKTAEEVENTAFKSWFDLQPTKNITRYDNKTKSNLGFQKFTADDWVNTIYKTYNEQASKNVKQIQDNTINQTQQTIPTNKVERIYENTPGEEVNYTEMERPNGKIRKHYRSIIESSNTTAEAKRIAKEMMGTDTYIPESNNSQIERADKYIENNGVEKALERLREHIENDEITYDNKGLLGSLTHKKVSVDDIALGERLIQYYSKIGDRSNLQDAIHYTAIMGTEAGRAVQVMSLLNHMTPQGQLVWLDRSITKMNNELQQRYGNKENTPQFELTSEMTDKLLNTKNQEDMYKVLDEIYEELGQQVPKTKLEQIDEWRYFSMLANIKTHGRNMIGNLAMGVTQRAKNKVAGAIEGTVAKFNPDMERTHTIVPTSKEVKEFAKNDVKNMDVQTELGMNENKYNPQSRLQSARRTFKSDVLENTLGKMFDLNSKLLEVEDNIGLKSMYVNSLGEYITANKLDIENMTDAQLSKARQHAIKEAQEATFHQASALATALNQMGRKNNIAKFALDSAIPFKKTPINVAKTGVQYSPVGLIKSAVYDVGKLRKGDITVNQYIDNVSKGLTGTGIAYLGYALAQAGILKASGGDDDKKEKYDEEQGKQTYSIEIGGKTYSLDWLSPVGIPLFIGAEINQQFNTKKKEKNSKSNDDDEFLSQAIQSVANIANASANAMNPMSEMSMLSGLTSILSSYNKENAIGDMFVNAGKSYVNQFVPTALGQLARTTDDYERTTKSTKTGTLEKAVDSTKNQIMSKIPGLRQMLPVATDVWGNEKEQKGNYIDNAVLPWNKKEITTNSTDKALTELYDKTGESSVLPDSFINKTLTYDKQKYRLTDQEYAELKKEYGKTSYAIVSGLTKSSEFNNMSEEQQVKAVSEAYKYAKAKIKSTYANWNDIDTEDSTAYKKVQDVVKNGGDAKDYFLYVGQTLNAKKEKEKIQILKDSDIGSKKAIYESTIGNDDKTYSILDNTSNFNIKDYLDYKLQDFSSDKEDDGTINGKTVSGSAKNKFYDYMDDSNFTYDQKLLLTGMKYKVTNTEREKIFDIIDDFNISKDDKLEIMSKMKGFTVYNNGRVSF